jgi:hypothetical protein
MIKNNYIKSFVLVIILLISSIIISPTLAQKTTVDQIKIDQYNKIKINIIDNGQNQDYYTYLTDEQVEELDELFINIKEQTINSKTLRDFNKIIFESIKSFRKLGLISDEMDIDKIIRVLKITIFYQSLSRYFDYFIKSTQPRPKENLFCTIVAHTNRSHFFRNTGWPVLTYWPVAINNQICYGTYVFPDENDPFPDWIPAEGWVYTKGWLGDIDWRGEFFGQISYNYFVSFSFYSVIGVRGFTGLRFEQDDEWVYYYGGAIRVKLGSTQPPDPKI